MTEKTDYTPHTLLIEPNQEKRICNALKKRSGCVIRVRKQMHGDLSPMASSSSHHDCTDKASHGILYLTPQQVNRLNNSPVESVVPLRFHDHHLQANLQHSGGFLPLLLAALAPVLGSVAGGFIEKEIAGRGLSKINDGTLIWHKHGKTKPVTFTIHPDNSPTSAGAGLYLRPWKGKGFVPHSGMGLYLNPYFSRHRGSSLNSGCIKLKNSHKIPCTQFSQSQKNVIANLV